MTNKEKVALAKEIDHRIDDFIKSMYADYVNVYKINNFDVPIDYVLPIAANTYKLTLTITSIITHNIQKGE